MCSRSLFGCIPVQIWKKNSHVTRAVTKREYGRAGKQDRVRENMGERIPERYIDIEQLVGEGEHTEFKRRRLSFDTVVDQKLIGANGMFTTIQRVLDTNTNIMRSLEANTNSMSSVLRGNTESLRSLQTTVDGLQTTVDGLKTDIVEIKQNMVTNVNTLKESMMQMQRDMQGIVETNRLEMVRRVDANQLAMNARFDIIDRRDLGRQLDEQLRP